MRKRFGRVPGVAGLFSHRLRALAHVLLYALGAFHWILFLDFGDIPFGMLDWFFEYQVNSVWKRSLESCVPPLHVVSECLDRGQFLAIPAVPLTPDIVLLRWLTVPQFSVLRLLIFYTAGYLGSAALISRHGWSWTGFLLFFLLFNFNGYVTSHVAVGHTSLYGGYFLLPPFFLLAFDWVKEGPSVRLALKLALLVLCVSLTGSFHSCTWCLVFVVLLGLRKSGWLKFSLLAAAVSAFLVAYRVLPGLAVYGTLKHGYPVGFCDPRLALTALVRVKPADHPPVGSMGWWEYDMYVGFVGLAVILLLGVAPLVVRGVFAFTDSRLRAFGLPLAGTALLSCGEVYYWGLWGIPVLSVERAVSRLLSVPVVLLAALAAVRLAELDRVPGLRRAAVPLCAGAILLMAAELLGHSWAWRVEAVSDMIPAVGGCSEAPAIVNRRDPSYLAALLAGAALTLAALAASILVIRKRSAR